MPACWESRAGTARGRSWHRAPSRLGLAVLATTGALASYLCFCHVREVPRACEAAIERLERSCELNRGQAMRLIRSRARAMGQDLEESCRHLMAGDSSGAWHTRLVRVGRRVPSFQSGPQEAMWASPEPGSDPVRVLCRGNTVP